MDRSLALQKVVLLNLVRLEELGVEYCQFLRKSEDLALCYDVEQRQGGHVLKAQCFCYRALHLEHGGAEQVRHESRHNDVATVGELVQGGSLDVLSPGHRSAAEALLRWLRCAKGTEPPCPLACVQRSAERAEMSHAGGSTLARRDNQASGVRPASSPSACARAAQRFRGIPQGRGTPGPPRCAPGPTRHAAEQQDLHAIQ